MILRGLRGDTPRFGCRLRELSAGLTKKCRPFTRLPGSSDRKRKRQRGFGGNANIATDEVFHSGRELDALFVRKLRSFRSLDRNNKEKLILVAIVNDGSAAKS